jgi:hypothetical protein
MSLLVLLLLAASAHAADVKDVPVSYEKFTVLGWGDGCSMVISQLGYPLVGQALADEPVSTKIGTIDIAPGEEKAAVHWRVNWRGAWTWKAKDAADALKKLSAKGLKPGIIEEMGEAPVVDARDLPRLILTTETLHIEVPFTPPDDPWRWTKIYYEPVDACVFFQYENSTGEGKTLKTFYDYRLLRIHNVTARQERALARTTNGLLLLEQGNLDGGLAETANAAALAPDFAPARYHHAALMSLSGVDPEATVDELEAAIKLDDKYRQVARQDKDFKSLRWHPKFQELTH